MSVIFKKSIPEWFNENLKDIYINKLVENNKKIEITQDEFNSLNDKQKKYIYPHILENENYNNISFTFLPDVNSHKDKYFLNYEEMKYFQKRLQIKKGIRKHPL